MADHVPAVGADSMVGIIDDSYDHDDDSIAARHRCQHHGLLGPSAAVLADILDRRGATPAKAALHQPMLLAARDPNAATAHAAKPAMAPRPPSGGRSSAGSRPSSGASRPATAVARRRPSTAAAVRAGGGGRTSSAASLPDKDDALAWKGPALAAAAKLAAPVPAAADRSLNATPPPLAHSPRAHSSPPTRRASAADVTSPRRFEVEEVVVPLPTWAPRHADVADVPQREATAAVGPASVHRSSSSVHAQQAGTNAIASWQQRLVHPDAVEDGAGCAAKPAAPIPARPSTAAARVAFQRPTSGRMERRQHLAEDPAASPVVLTASMVAAPAAVPRFMRGSVFDRVARSRPASAAATARRAAADTGAPFPASTATAAKEERPAAWRAALGRATAANAAREAREKVKPPPPTGQQRASSARGARARRASPVPDIPFLKAVPTESYFLEASYADAVSKAKAEVRKEHKQRQQQQQQQQQRAVAADEASKRAEEAAACGQAEAAKRVRMQRLFLARTPADDARKARLASEIAARDAAAVREVGRRRVTAAVKLATAQLATLSDQQRAAVHNDAARCIGRWWRCRLGLLRGREARRASRLSVAARVTRDERAAEGKARLRGAIRRYLRERVYSVRLRLAVTRLQAAWRGRQVRVRLAPLEARRVECAAYALETVRFERASYATSVIGSAWRASVWRRNDLQRRRLVARGQVFRLQRTIAAAYTEHHAPQFRRQLHGLRQKLAARQIQRSWGAYLAWREAAADTFCRRFKLAPSKTKNNGETQRR